MKMEKINKKRYDELINDLATKLKLDGVKSTYGVPKNGSIIAESLWLQHAIEIKENPLDAEAIVDDLIDSGRTRDKYRNKPFYTLIKKNDNKWVHFWFEKDVEDDFETLITRLIQIIKGNPERKIETLKRIERLK